MLGGILGSPTDHHAAPYSMTEEFLSAHRPHPLIPDEVTVRDHTGGRPRGHRLRRHAGRDHPQRGSTSGPSTFCVTASGASRAPARQMLRKRRLLPSGSSPEGTRGTPRCSRTCTTEGSTGLFTTGHRPEVHPAEGLERDDRNSMVTVLLRHHPRGLRRTGAQRGRCGRLQNRESRRRDREEEDVPTRVSARRDAPRWWRRW